MGPTKPKSLVLPAAEKAGIVGFRRRTLLPWDDAMGCWHESIPRLRHGMSRLPASDIRASTRGKIAPTQTGYVHIDIAELRLRPVCGRQPDLSLLTFVW